MALAEDFQRVLDALPPDWTDLEIDLRIDEEERYIDTAVALSQVNAQVYQHPQEGWHWRLLVAHSFGHAAAAETVAGVLAKLDALLPALSPGTFDIRVLREWAAWDFEHGLLPEKLDVAEAFILGR